MKTELQILETILKDICAIRKREEERHMMDEQLSMFSEDIDELIEKLEDIVYWEPSDEDMLNYG